MLGDDTWTDLSHLIHAVDVTRNAETTLCDIPVSDESSASNSVWCDTCAMKILTAPAQGRTASRRHYWIPVSDGARHAFRGLIADSEESDTSVCGKWRRRETTTRLAIGS